MSNSDNKMVCQTSCLASCAFFAHRCFPVSLFQQTETRPPQEMTQQELSVFVSCSNSTPTPCQFFLCLCLPSGPRTAQSNGGFESKPIVFIVLFRLDLFCFGQQSRFQTMSDAIVGRSMSSLHFLHFSFFSHFFFLLLFLAS